MTQPRLKPMAVMLSKRANVFYLEHARVMQKDDRVVYLTESGEPIDQFFNIPERNTAFILLGKGTSITDSAARKLAESNVIVGFCGSGGSPLFSSVDYMFLTTQSEYRPTEYMQTWMQIWVNDERRLELAKKLLNLRMEGVEKAWRMNTSLQSRGIGVSDKSVEKFNIEVGRSVSTEELLLAEARWAKQLYAKLSRGFEVPFSREEGKGGTSSLADKINSYLDHGNYIAYGYAAVALNGLGISFSLPLLHGKTRRGALVFDLADVIKDSYVMPAAFEAAKEGIGARDFRSGLIEICQTEKVLDATFDLVLNLIKKT